MNADQHVNLSHADILGAVQRGLRELVAGLDQSPSAINYEAAVAHLSRMGDLLQSLGATFAQAKKTADAA